MTGLQHVSHLREHAILAIHFLELGDRERKLLVESARRFFDALSDRTFDKNALSGNDLAEGYRLTVMDALGRQVFDSGKQYSETFDLNKSSIGRGLFIARVTVGSKNSTVVKKIVFE